LTSFFKKFPFFEGVPAGRGSFWFFRKNKKQKTRFLDKLEMMNYKREELPRQAAPATPSKEGE